MPPEDDIRQLSHEWLAIAESNFRYASAPVERVRWEDRCFEAQQAVEKAIKAVLVRDQIEFPRTHDIGDLLDLAAASGRVIPFDEARFLSDFATAARYPGWDRRVTQDDYRRVIDLAERVLDWARRIVEDG